MPVRAKVVAVQFLVPGDMLHSQQKRKSAELELLMDLEVSASYILVFTSQLQPSHTTKTTTGGGLLVVSENHSNTEKQ